MPFENTAPLLMFELDLHTPEIDCIILKLQNYQEFTTFDYKR